MFYRNPSRRLGRALRFAAGIATLFLVVATTSSAQSSDKKTVVTFNVPVEIPGAGAQVLPPGTYIFKLLGMPSYDRHIVQVLNKEETHVYATILAIPNSRLRATDKTVMTFSERVVGEPQAIQAWFYPGDNLGQEFVYPKKRAVELAKITQKPVLFIPDEVAPNIVAVVEPVEAVKIAALPPVIALKEAPVQAVLPTGETVAETVVVQRPPVQTAALLPKTASNLPWLMLLGFLAIGAGVSFKTLCDR